jgi:predicted enzyme related to lactoylglutathione lyase/quinol monooxygenase YgiN
MKTAKNAPVHLISRWIVRAGREKRAIAALTKLAEEVLAHEPGTLTYHVHTPIMDDEALPPALPPSIAQEVVFYESYASAQAFNDHVNGPLFTKFVQEHGGLFLSPPDSPGKPFIRVQFLQLQAGFTREKPSGSAQASSPAPANRHPSVMFEIIARKQGPMLDFYRSLFGWTYQFGTGHFGYVRFPSEPQPLLGGIGQADPSVPGFEPGRSFYLLVDDLKATLDRAGKLGGSTYVEPTEVDGYHFAMMKDPEGNIIGLIQPFTSETGPQSSRKKGKARPRKSSR